MSVGKISSGQTSIGQMSIDRMFLCLIPIAQMSNIQMSADQMLIGQMALAKWHWPNGIGQMFLSLMTIGQIFLRLMTIGQMSAGRNVHSPIIHPSNVRQTNVFLTEMCRTISLNYFCWMYQLPIMADYLFVSGHGLEPQPTEDLLWCQSYKTCSFVTKMWPK